jgi:hypothetical protein
MKTGRIWILLLLAVLLPVRGAVAAAMQCPAVGSSVPGQVMTHELDSYHQDAGHHEHATEPVDGHADHDHANSEGCNMCAAFCSMTPLVASTPPSLHEPVGLSAVKFSDYSAAAPSFLSDGQERPPRTI